MPRLLLLAAAVLGTVAASSAQTTLRLDPVGTYATGRYDESAAEIVDYDPATRRAFFVNADAGQVQAIDLSDPAQPTLVFSIDTPAGTSPNGVAVRGGIVAVAVEAALSTDPGTVRFYTNKGSFLGSVAVGALPDGLAFDASGRYLVVAGEGEPAAGIDPLGTVSVIDLGAGVAGATVATLDFTAFNAGGPRNAELGPDVLLDASAPTVAQDLEPEFVSVLGTRAYVTLQEANAVAVVDLASPQVVGVYGLGLKDHRLGGRGLDASDQDGAINIALWPVYGAYQPDAVAAFEEGGQVFLVTANEGDARSDARVASLTLDPTAFPDAATLQLPANLGRLNVIPTVGDDDGDGDYDRLVAFGARSFSVWRVDPSGLALVYDSGDAFEQLTAARVPATFNASNTNNTFDNRSDDKGPEPEAVTVGEIDGRRYAFVGLERVGGVMVYDLTAPSSPAFVTYVNPRDFTAAPSSGAAGDLGPEGLRFVSAGDSPTGAPLLIVSNEVSGTVTTYAVGGGFTLTLLHNNDGESKLLPTTVAGFGEVGGVARFVALVDRLKAQARATTDGVLLVSSGDNFLAGPEFNASLTRGLPFYDALALDEAGYDAFAIGNHEFDFGPDVLADFIESFETPPPFVSATLDVSAEPRLAVLADAGTIVPRTVVTVGGRRVGIVGATTPRLRAISSPRDVVVLQDVAGLVQAQVDALAAEDVEIVVLISHLQSVDEDRALVPMLRGVDVAVAGGGDELLANPGDVLIPNADGTFPTPSGAYPLLVTDGDGRTVPIVTTSGDYRYIGRLVAEFDAAGTLVAVGDASGPVRVVGAGPDAIAPDASVQARVVEPVRAAIAGLAANVIGTTEVPLDGRRPPIRIQETNLGNLLADALLATADSLNEAFDAPQPDVAIQNGGGIRNNSLLPVGPLTELTTFQVAAFSNFVSIVPDIPAAQFKEILEQAYAGLPAQNGAFAQVAGFTVVVDSTQQAQTVDVSGTVTREGRRVRRIALDDGTLLVDGGLVVPGARAVAIATNDFSARGGDSYPFRGAEFVTLGVTYQQALLAFVQESLGGVVSAADYPEGGEGRIVFGTGGVNAEDTPADRFAFAGVAPNPTRGQASLGLALPSAADVRVDVYDLLGRRVAGSLAALPAGTHALAVDLRGLSAGAYLVRVTAVGATETHAATGRLTLVR